VNQKFHNVDVLKGLLVFAPFYLSLTSFLIGLKTGLVVFSCIFLISPLLFLLRKIVIHPQQYIIFVLLISTSSVLILRMLLHAEAYTFVDNINLFLPLLLINSFVLIEFETIITSSGFQSIFKRLIEFGIAILLFFIVFGALQEVLNRISIFNSPIGFFFLSGFLIAMVNLFNSKENS